jgi:hypothetical protein
MALRLGSDGSRGRFPPPQGSGVDSRRLNNRTNLFKGSIDYA